MPEIVITGLTKRFGQTTVVDSLSLTVADGQLVTLLGPSGCGKTTTLRCIAGLEAPDAGEIRFGNELVTQGSRFVPPERRGIGMMFQSYALWPHMTVAENIAYSLTLQHLSKQEVSQRVEAALALANLSGLEKRHPGQLSGGQQQRVALARSVAAEPRLLLFDEPLSNLDARLREKMRSDLHAVLKRIKITTIYVTHDQTEAMAISDLIVVMNQGRIEQIGSPQDLYESPVNGFVANFLGTMNFIDGRTGPKNGHMSEVQVNGGLTIQCKLPDSLAAGSLVRVGLRPEHAEVVAADAPPRMNQWQLPILSTTYLGNHGELLVDFGGTSLQMLVPSHVYRQVVGRSRCTIAIDPERVLYFADAAT